MIYESIFTGQQIDELLEAVSKIKKVTSGWVMMDSTSENPLDINTLTNPGNYSVNYWTNSPENKDYSSPLKIITTKETINGKEYIHQYIYSLGYNTDAYSRYYDMSDDTYSDWVDEDLTPGVSVSDTAPTDPNTNDLWFDTNTTGSIIKYYDSTTGEWKSLNPDDYMDPNTYNSSGTSFPNGIYNHINERLSNISTSGEEVDFLEHINDSTIHLSTTEKTELDAKPTTSDLADAMQILSNALVQTVANKAAESGIDMSAYETILNELNESLNTHSADNVAHPSAEQIAKWDSKADGNHTHDISEITLDVENVTGTYSMDILPDSIKERMTVLNTIDEANSLSINDIQNGDWIFTKDEKILYQVVDDSKFEPTTISVENTISDTSRNWWSVCYGNGKYVAVAYDSTISAYSTDGINWVENTISDTSRYWYSVCYGNGKYVAVAYNSTYSAYSTDGINWIENTISSTSRNWYSVCYGNGKYVAIAWYDTYSAYSTDGINWVENTISDTSRYWYSVCYGNGKFVAVAYNDNYYAYSTDGINWIETTISDTSRYWRSVCYGNGKYVAIAKYSTISAYSTDGINWIENTISDTSRNWYSVCYGNGKYVAVADNSTYYAYSTDGINWIENTISDTNRYWQSVCYGNGKFVAIAYDSNYSAYISFTTPIAALQMLNTPAEEITWDKITDKPTSLEELGIDYTSNTEVDNLITSLDTQSTNVNDQLSPINDILLTKPSASSRDNLLKDYAYHLETLIDIIDKKMQFINHFVYEEVHDVYVVPEEE